MTSPLAPSLTAKFAVVSLHTSQGTASTQPPKALQLTETSLSPNNTSQAFRQPGSPKYQLKRAAGLAATETRLPGAGKRDSEHTKETSLSSPPRPGEAKRCKTLRTPVAEPPTCQQPATGAVSERELLIWFFCFYTLRVGSPLPPPPFGALPRAPLLRAARPAPHGR